MQLFFFLLNQKQILFFYLYFLSKNFALLIFHFKTSLKPFDGLFLFKFFRLRYVLFLFFMLVILKEKLEEILLLFFLRGCHFFEYLGTQEVVFFLEF